MKKRLQEIHDTISNLLIYSDDNVRQYIQILKETLSLIEKIDTEPNSVLETWKNTSIDEIANELANRVNEHFFTADLERKKSEFKFSKSIISMSITNILMNY